MPNNRIDYIMVALGNVITNQDEIFAKHWNKVLNTKIWISNDGTEYKFEEIDDSHLRSIIKMLIRFNDPSAESLIVELMKVLISRNKF